jgi:hypothetical protein
VRRRVAAFPRRGMSRRSKSADLSAHSKFGHYQISWQTQEALASNGDKLFHFRTAITIKLMKNIF